jgi:hypothetical protein
MSEPQFVDFSDESLPLLADEAWLLAQMRADTNGAGPVQELHERPWAPETWATFRDTADEEISWNIEGLLPAGSFAFIAAPPKKGKTWLALYMAICLSTGTRLLGEYAIPDPVPTLYCALEGARAALRARTGSLARGCGIDPDGDALDHLHMLYRPRPFDLARPESALWLEQAVAELEARFVVVDVLRAAARFRENVAEDFAVVRDAFEPMLRSGVTIAVLHHFGKLNDSQSDRSPGERMAGTGAMYGAMDVGFLITQSTDRARRLRVDVDARDFAAPDAIGLRLDGTGSAHHGGFTYTDRAEFVLDASAAEERDLVGELEQLFRDGKWRTLTEIRDAKKGGIGANPDEVRAALSEHPGRFVQVAGEEVGRHKSAKPWGSVTMSQRVTSGVESPESPSLFGDAGGPGYVGDSSPVGGVRVTHTGDELSLTPDSESPLPDIEF